MAFEKTPMGDGKYLYRCPDCGKEYPNSPVPESKLGLAPPHDCKQGREIQFDSEQERKHKT